MNRTVALIQARMASQRLPGKVLADIEGRPMLGRMVDRLSRLQTVDDLAVATTIDPVDDSVFAWCSREGVACLRGATSDVLDRFHAAAEITRAAVIVRLTADCPLIDPAVVDLCVTAFRESDPPVDLVVNRLPWERTYPIGLDTEVFSRQALDTAWREAREPHQREHVVPFLYENPDRFRLVHLKTDPDFGRMRWTVDEADDLKAVRQIFRAFEGRDDFGWMEVVELLRRSPELAAINAAVVHRSHRSAESPRGTRDG